MNKIMLKLIGNYLNTLSIVLPDTAARHGFNLFCYPIRPPLKAHHKEFLERAEGFVLYEKGKRIQGYKWGIGSKKILFVHGWKSHSFYWKNYINSLPESEFSIYAIDAPGHGFSEGNFLNVPYYSNIISKAIKFIGGVDTVVSHSIGSFSMMHLLHTNPNLNVGKLVIMSPPSNAVDFFKYYRELLKISTKTEKLILDHFIKELNKPIGYFSTVSFASNLNLPGIIIHDKEDRETPYENAILIQNVWKNSQLITTQGLGHNLKSPEVVEIVKNFIVEYNIQKVKQ